MLNNFKKTKSGFTLLEILLVIGIISILAGIVIIAINPGRQLATVRNTERKSDIKQLNNALQQYYIDHRQYPTSTPIVLTEVCDTGTGEYGVHEVDCTDLIDLSTLVPTYITAIPADPSGASSTLSLLNTLITPAYAATGGAGYKVMKDTTNNNKLVLTAPLAELGAIIAIGTTTVTAVEPAATYTVTYNGNTSDGGTVPTDSTEYEEGETVTVLGNTGTLTKTGYTFSSWNTAANGSGTSYDAADTFSMPASNITLYAQWTVEPFVATGGNTTTIVGDYTIHTFTTTGESTFTVTSGSSDVDVLVVGGGGGGGSRSGGGGGGGGVIYETEREVTSGSYGVVVGNGGAGGAGGGGGAYGVSGANSSFDGLVAIGGGGGSYAVSGTGLNGGSGGGGSWTYAGGSGTAGQGYAGGTSAGDTAAGGGGATHVGYNTVSSTVAGNGGAGRTVDITGSSIVYGSGGGGGAYGNKTAGTGGTSAGNGSNMNSTGGTGVANRGGGGGGGGQVNSDPWLATAAGAGGKGVVIIRYLTP